jgi:hypothetical protein
MTLSRTPHQQWQFKPFWTVTVEHSMKVYSILLSVVMLNVVAPRIDTKNVEVNQNLFLQMGTLKAPRQSP